jgi:hypothetical protein
MSVSDIKFHENPSDGAALMHADRWTDMPKVTGTFFDYANVPKN